MTQEELDAIWAEHLSNKRPAINVFVYTRGHDDVIEVENAGVWSRRVGSKQWEQRSRQETVLDNSPPGAS